MSTVNVVNWKNEKVGRVELPKEVFGVAVNDGVLHTVVQWQLACRRQGTHMVKTRALVSGGGKKPFKQKGTGGARQGTNRSPLMPGGAKLFGPEPRSYAYALPKKIRRLGLSMALSYLHENGRLIVVDTVASKTGKTKDMAASLNSLGLEKAVLVSPEVNELTKRAAKNLAKFKYLPVEGVNVFDLLKYDTLVLSSDSVKSLTDRCLLG